MATIQQHHIGSVNSAKRFVVLERMGFVFVAQGIGRQNRPMLKPQ